MRPKAEFSFADKAVLRKIFMNGDEVENNEIDTILEFIKKRQAKSIANPGSNGAAVSATVAAATTAATENDTGNILTYPTNVSKGAITINTKDYECLAPNVYLNDVIIDFYLKYLQTEILSEEQKQKTHIFSTFFYNALNSHAPRATDATRRMSAAQKRHERVKKWTKDVNIFEKDFIIVPINQSEHWFLAIICFPSLALPNTTARTRDSTIGFAASSRTSTGRKRQSTDFDVVEIDDEHSEGSKRMLRSRAPEKSSKR